MGRVVAEACPRLDIRELKRRSWRFGWKTLSYSSGASISFVGTHDALKLSYRASGVPVDYEIRIARTAMHFGNEREWLVCPGCQKRFAILYIAGRNFRCRKCNGLAYKTQHEKPHGRLLIKAERLWRRAGCEFGGEGGKPKWMQWRTFDRLMAAANEAWWGSWNSPRILRALEKVRL